MIPKTLQIPRILGASSSASMALHFCRTRNRSVVDPSVIRLFSASSWPPPPPPPPSEAKAEGNDNSKPDSLASYFSNIKSTLKNQQKTAAPNPDAIRNYLSEFRGVSPADSQSPRQSSFKDIFKTESFPNPQDGATTAPGTPSYEIIAQTLKQLGANTGANDFSQRSRIQYNNTGPRVTGGPSDWLPMHGLNENVEGSSGKSELRTAFEKRYSTTELGEKLRKLRPDGRDKGGWFSLTELNERLVKLKELEKAERESTRRDAFFSTEDMRRSLIVTDEERMIKNGKLRLSLLGNYDSTQDFMPNSPKEHLVEKYFHPDNMSSAEKMKIELAKVREEFKMSESDCGSFRVQVAQLTTKIKHLSDALHKKDKHSRKGLQAMVERRKKLLKYLRRTDWDSYCFVLSKLGLRDNPEFRQSNVAGKKKLLSR